MQRRRMPRSESLHDQPVGYIPGLLSRYRCEYITYPVALLPTLPRLSQFPRMVATPADMALANSYAEEYANQVWLLVMPFLFLLGIIHYGSIALRKLFPGKKESADIEADSRGSRRASALRRLPLAIANAYRVVAFRTTFTVGPLSLNLAEVTLTIAYIIALFVWSFINSTHHGILFAHELTISHSYVSRWDKVRTCILCKPRGEHRQRSAPTCRCPWY